MQLLQPHFGQVWGWNSHSQSWGFGVLRDSRIFRVQQQGAKHFALRCSWCHWKGLEVYMSEMASHWSFGHLQPKLWAKEGPEVKLAVWLPTTKSWESTRSWRALGECDTALESYRRGLQVWFRPCPDRRSGREAMMPQSPRSPKPGQFRDSTWGVPGQTTTWVWAWRSNAENTIRRMVVTPLEPGPWCVMWVRVSLWLVPTPNACRMSSNQLVLVLDAGSWPNSLISS
jgi:hypothetical protein